MLANFSDSVEWDTHLLQKSLEWNKYKLNTKKYKQQEDDTQASKVLGHEVNSYPLFWTQTKFRKMLLIYLLTIPIIYM